MILLFWIYPRPRLNVFYWPWFGLNSFTRTLACLHPHFPSMPRRVARIWKRGGFFERVRKVQTTLTRIFIVLESESQGLSGNWNGISQKARKFKRFFSQKQVISKKKRSAPKLRLIFRPKSEIQTFFLSKQKQVISKKKGLHRHWDWFFG